MAYSLAIGGPKGCCDRCGFVFNHSRLRREWTGLMVCSGPGTNDCWDPRHPQDFVKAVPDRQSFPNPRPDPEPVFVDPGDITADDL